LSPLADTLLATVTLNKFETCYQQSADGALDITVTGGQAPYILTLDGENFDTVSSVASYTDLSYGIYYFQIEDASGCIFNLKDSIVAGSIPWATSSISNLIGCSGDSLMAEVLMTGSNGTGPFTFAWDDGTTTDQKILSAPSDYNVTVTDADGCWTRDNIIILGPDTLQVEIQSITDAFCHADTNGVIAVTAHGGFKPYSFSIDEGATYQLDSTFNNLTIGDYEVIVKDDHDCLDTISANITFTNALSATIVTENVTCNGGSNGRITANLLGGIAPFSYSLNDIDYQPSNVFLNLMPGMYDVYIQDGSGCKAAYFGNVITEPTALVVSTSVINDEACGQMNGSASGTASGGTAPLSFEWDGNPSLNSLILTNVSAGVHTLEVTDANGCIQTSSVTITNLSAPSVSVLSFTDEICGNNNGSIEVQVVDGTGPMTFNWSHNADLDAASANNLSAGTYSVTVTDANNCTDFLTTTISEIAGPELSVLSKSNSLCTDDNGMILMQTSLGTAPMNYSWSHDSGLNSETATGLSAGTYSVIVTDANGCQDDLTLSIDFDAPPVIGAATISQETCIQSNGTIEIPVASGTAPYQYSWSHDPILNSATANDLSGGLYSVTVTDALGCTAELVNINVDSPAPPILSVSSFVNSDCLNPLGSVTVSTTEGLAPYTYAWSHDPNATSETITDLMSGTYTATVTDANGCTAKTSQSLISFVGSTEITNELDCFGDSDASIQLTLEGNFSDYTFVWSDAGIPAGPSASNLSAGIYSVSVTNTNGCMEIYTEEILDPEQIIPNISNVIPVGCLGNLGSALSVPTGGTGNYSFIWDDLNAQSTANIENLTIGTYSVTVTDNLGCSNTESVTIESSTPLSISEDLVTMPLCSGDSNGSISTTVSGGFGNIEYNWNSNQDVSSISNLPAGEYSLTVSDEVGCTAELMVQLDEPSALVIENMEVTNPNCPFETNGALEIFVEGGTPSYNYNWNGGILPNSSTLTNLSAGDYDLILTDANGCQLFESFIIFDPPQVEITDAIVTPGLCSNVPNGAISVSAFGGTGNLNYNWSNGEQGTTINNLASGSYTLTVTDVYGCLDTETFEVTSSQVENISLGQGDTLVCNGAVLYYDFSEEPFESYSWGSAAEGSLSDAPIFSITNEGTYFFSATNDQGCVVTDTIEVGYAAQNLDAFFIAPTDIVVGDTLVAVELTLPIPDEVSWSYNSNAIEFVGQNENQYLFTFSEVGTYDLSLSARLGNCHSEINKRIFVYADSMEIPFINPLVPEILDVRLFPNPSDGIFTLEVDLSAEKDMVIDIFDTQSLLYDRAIFSGAKNYSKDYNLTLQSGIYYAIIQVAGERRSLTLVVN